MALEIVWPISLLSTRREIRQHFRPHGHRGEFLTNSREKHASASLTRWFRVSRKCHQILRNCCLEMHCGPPSPALSLLFLILGA